MRQASRCMMNDDGHEQNIIDTAAVKWVSVQVS